MEKGEEGESDEEISDLLNVPSNRMIDVNVNVTTAFCSNSITLSIDEHGRSSHPHHSESTPVSFSDTTPPTYIVDSESLALFIR